MQVSGGRTVQAQRTVRGKVDKEENPAARPHRTSCGEDCAFYSE